ncbi:hypothetical protein IQ17_03788, partial [Bradyrhizobium daqingense]
SAPTGAGPVNSVRVREARRNSAPGRARHKPSDHRAGKAVCWASPVCCCAVLPACAFAQRTAGAAGTRPSLHPLGYEGGAIKQSSGEMRREAAKPCPRVIYFLLEMGCCSKFRHCEERSDEAIQNPSTKGLWIASSQGLLAMTWRECAPHSALVPRTQRSVPSTMRCRAGAHLSAWTVPPLAHLAPSF